MDGHDGGRRRERPGRAGWTLPKSWGRKTLGEPDFTKVQPDFTKDGVVWHSDFGTGPANRLPFKLGQLPGRPRRAPPQLRAPGGGASLEATRTNGDPDGRGVSLRPFAVTPRRLVHPAPPPRPASLVPRAGMRAVAELDGTAACRLTVGPLSHRLLRGGLGLSTGKSDVLGYRRLCGRQTDHCRTGIRVRQRGWCLCVCVCRGVQLGGRPAGRGARTRAAISRPCTSRAPAAVTVGAAIRSSGCVLSPDLLQGLPLTSLRQLLFSLPRP